MSEREPDIESGDENLIAEASGALGASIKSLRACVDRVGTELDEADKYSTSKASHMAFLGKGLAVILREVRQLEKHDADAVKRMSPAERDKYVKAYIGLLPRARRMEFRDLLDELDAKEKVL